MRYPLISAVLTSLLLAACGPAPIVSPSPSPTATGSASPSPEPSPEPSAGTSPTPSPSPAGNGTSSGPGASATPPPISGTGSNVISNQLGSVRLTPAHLFLSRVGETQRFTLEARDASGNLVDVSGLSLQWSSSNPAIVAVDGNGTVKAMTEFGNAIITVREPRSGLSVTGQVDITSYEVGSGGSGGGGGGSSKPSERINANLNGFEGLGFNEFYLNESENFTNDPEESYNPVLAINASGTAVVAWENDEEDIMAQRFGSNGLPLGVAFTVGQFDGSHVSPAVAIADNGRFVISWAGDDVSGGDNSDIYAAIYNADGSFDTNFRVNQFMSNDQEHPAVAIDSQGDFAIAWVSNQQNGNDDEDVYARLYDSQGGTIRSEFQVNMTTTDSQNIPAIAMAADGRFVIVWESSNQINGQGVDIFGATYDSGGNAAVSEFRVNAFSTSAQDRADVAMHSDGSFIVTWTSEDQPGGDDLDVVARAFSASASAPASEFIVNENIFADQQDPSIDMDADGDFVVTWQGYDHTYDSYYEDLIFARHYQNGGTADSGEFRVSVSILDDHESPDVALDADGDALFVWHGVLDDGPAGILGRRYSSDGQPR